jgi:hypothetical protein
MTMTKTSFSSLYSMCSEYIAYLNFTRLIGYILQVIALKYYIEEVGVEVY